MSGEHTFGASDDIVRRIRENLPHIEWEQPLSAERERLAADEIERLRAEVQEKRVDVGELIAQIVRRDDEIVRLRAAGDALAAIVGDVVVSYDDESKARTMVAAYDAWREARRER